MPKPESTNFTSLPREIRDIIYDLTFLPHEPRIIQRPSASNRTYIRSHGWGLLATIASNPRIASEARTVFFSRPLFTAKLSTKPPPAMAECVVASGVEGSIGPFTRIVRFDVMPYVSNVEVKVWMGELREARGLEKRLGYLCLYTGLRNLTFAINGKIILEEAEDLRKAFTVLQDVTEPWIKVLGDGCRFSMWISGYGMDLCLINGIELHPDDYTGRVSGSCKILGALAEVGLNG